MGGRMVARKRRKGGTCVPLCIIASHNHESNCSHSTVYPIHSWVGHMSSGEEENLFD